MSAATEASLLQVIIGHPHDEAARLAYADAVAQSQPERAEFIRLEVRLARDRRANYRPPDYLALKERERLLRPKNLAAAAELASEVSHWEFRRGFPELIELPAAEFLAKGEALYRMAPILHLTLTAARARLRDLMASPLLDRIVSLSLFDQGLDDDDAETLAASTHLGNLRWLELSNNKIGDPGLAALAASQRLARLQYLGFTGNLAEDPGPRIGGSESDGHFDYAYPEAGRRLAERFGARAWLTASPPSWPPERDEV